MAALKVWISGPTILVAMDVGIAMQIIVKKQLEQTVENTTQTPPLLIGEVGPEDKITERKMFSCKVNQLRLDL